MVKTKVTWSNVNSPEILLRTDVARFPSLVISNVLTLVTATTQACFQTKNCFKCVDLIGLTPQGQSSERHLPGTIVPSSDIFDKW